MGATEAKNWQYQGHEQRVTEPQRETKRQVKVKVNKRWVTTGEKFIYTVFSAVAVIGLFFTVSFSSTADSLNRDVQKLEQEVKQQQTVNKNLEYKVKELSNPDRILTIAKENGLKIQNTEVKQASVFSN